MFLNFFLEFCNIQTYVYIFFNISISFLGHTSYNGPSYGFKNESITSKSTKYVKRSTAVKQIITSKYIKVSEK